MPTSPVILAIETATPRGSVALWSDGAVVAEIFLADGVQASITCMSAVEKILAGIVPTYVAVSSGPGSFTGLRVGMAAAKGFCMGWGVPLVSVPTLKALAASRLDEGMPVLCLLDARKGEVYAGLYTVGGAEPVPLMPERAVEPGLLCDLLPGDGQIALCGDGAVAYETLLRSRLGARARFPVAGDGFPKASSVARLAARSVAAGGFSGHAGAVPVYLRVPEAEQRRNEALEKASGAD